jgi:hypothetical protein
MIQSPYKTRGNTDILISYAYSIWKCNDIYALPKRRLVSVGELTLDLIS